MSRRVSDQIPPLIFSYMPLPLISYDHAGNTKNTSRPVAYVLARTKKNHNILDFSSRNFFFLSLDFFLKRALARKGQGKIS